MATYTYDADNWTATAKDRTRSALGDIDVSGGVNTALRSDEAITASITASGEPLGTALLAEGLAAEYAQFPDSLSTGGSSFSWRERVKNWLALAKRLRDELAAEAAVAGSNFANREAVRGDEITSEYVRPAWWTP